jgi:O-antigen ligase
MTTASLPSKLTTPSPTLPPPNRFPWHLMPIVVFILATLAAIGVMLLVPAASQLALLLPIALVMGLVMVVRPELALLLSIAYVPFESSAFKPVSLPGDLTISKLLGFVLLGVFIFNVIFKGRKFRILDDSQDFAIVLFAATMLISGVSSYLPGKTFDSAERMLRIFAFYFAVKNLLSSFWVIRGAMWIMTISGAIASAIGINEYFRLNAVRNFDGRARGVLMDPNDYAALTLVVIWVGVYLFVITRNWMLKLLIAGCTAISFLGLIFSASRGGFLAAAVTIFIFIWRHPRRQLLMVTLAAATVIALPFLPPSILSRLGGLFGSSTDIYASYAEQNTERRLSYVIFGAEAISENPLTGSGYGTFSQLYPSSEYAQYDNPLNNLSRYRLAHNAYLEIGFGTGVVGLTLFLVILFVSLRDFNNVMRWSPRGSLMWGAAGSFQLGLLALSITMVFLSIEHFNYIWICVAMSSVLAYQMRWEKRRLELAKEPPLELERAAVSFSA